jgi:CheY-like chemotaxis protein
MNSDAASIKILVVEDEELHRWTIVRKLGEAGYSVHEACSCADAERLADCMEFDLIVTDFRLSDGYGDALVGRIAQKAGRCEVIIMTGEPDLVKAEGGDRVRILTVMTKPIDFGVMLGLIEKWRPGSGRTRGLAGGVLGAYTILSISVPEDILRASDVKGDVALVFEDGSWCGDVAEAVRSIRTLCDGCGSVCAVAGSDTVVGLALREAGFDVLEGMPELRARARKLIGTNERKAVLSVIG